MGVLSIYKKSRYTLNPTHHYYSSNTLLCSTPTPHVLYPYYSLIPTTGFLSIPPFFASTASISSFSLNFSFGSILYHTCRSNLCVPNAGILSYDNKFRFFSSSSSSARVLGDKALNHSRIGMSMGEINSMLDIVKNDGDNMESKLDSIASNLSKWSVIEILRGLNAAKVPALRLFEWIKDVHPNHCRNADVCSLMIDNCGRLGDYTTMVALLKDFSGNRICLTSNAFGFLPVLSTTKGSAERSVEGVISVLDEIGGSCRNSGIHSLLELLCSLSSFDLARFVIEVTEKRASYFSVLVKHLCVKHQFEAARNLIEEMWQIGCVPEATAYNYLISSLCKQGDIDKAFAIPQEMLDRKCPPDVITYKILIYFACRREMSDNAIKFYEQMIARGIRATLPIHCAFIRGLFNSQQFEKAYRYVVDAAAKDKWPAQYIYNVLAGLHQKHGDLLVAHNLLVEMIEKGLRPKQSLYLRVSRRLYKTGKQNFAKNLKDRFNSLMLKIRKNDG